MENSLHAIMWLKILMCWWINLTVFILIYCLSIWKHATLNERCIVETHSVRYVQTFWRRRQQRQWRRQQQQQWWQTQPYGTVICNIRNMCLNTNIIFGFTSSPSLMSWMSHIFDVGLHGIIISWYWAPFKKGLSTFTIGCCGSNQHRKKSIKLKIRLMKLNRLKFTFNK